MHAAGETGPIECEGVTEEFGRRFRIYTWEGSKECWGVKFTKRLEVFIHVKNILFALRIQIERTQIQGVQLSLPGLLVQVIIKALSGKGHGLPCIKYL